jgi:hypothetical protein
LERGELEDRDLARDRHGVMAELDEINSRIVALGYGGGEQGKGTDGEWRSLQDQGSGEELVLLRAYSSEVSHFRRKRASE